MNVNAETPGEVPWRALDRKCPTDRFICAKVPAGAGCAGRSSTAVFIVSLPGNGGRRPGWLAGGCGHWFSYVVGLVRK